MSGRTSSEKELAEVMAYIEELEQRFTGLIQPLSPKEKDQSEVKEAMDYVNQLEHQLQNLILPLDSPKESLCSEDEIDKETEGLLDKLLKTLEKNPVPLVQKHMSSIQLQEERENTQQAITTAIEIKKRKQMAMQSRQMAAKRIGSYPINFNHTLRPHKQERDGEYIHINLNKKEEDEFKYMWATMNTNQALSEEDINRIAKKSYRDQAMQKMWREVKELTGRDTFKPFIPKKTTDQSLDSKSNKKLKKMLYWKGLQAIRKANRQNKSKTNGSIE